MAAELITLKEWGQRIYGAAAPSMGTLRRWAREARIFPTPRKHGRSYFVEPEARYVDYRTLKEEVRSQARTAARERAPGRLVERLIRGGKA